MAVAEFQFVNYLWNDDVVTDLSPAERLVYRSNILGADQRITNTGGGNTSTKTVEIDPLTGEHVEVLWVKGSGGDLRTAKLANFSSLYQDRLVALQDIYHKTKPNGVKTAIEDQMVDMYRHCTFNLNPRPSSIDTPLHAFIPYKHVDHMHPNAVIAIAAASNGEELMREIYGDEVIWTDWQRPGFDLGLKLQEICRQYPQAKGVMLGQHGIINWADDDRECYELTLRLIEMAAQYIEKHDRAKETFGGAKYQSLEQGKRHEVFAQILPWLRGKVSRDKRFIGTVQEDETILRFVNSQDAARLAAMGTSCPDHFLRTKIKPLFVDWNPQSESVDSLKKKLEEGLQQYQQDYEAYYNRCKHADSPPLRTSTPTVTLIPGLGMIAWGKNKSESRVTAEFYNCAVEVMRGAEAIGAYRGLPEQEAFDIEYWWLEENKLRRMPPAKPLEGQVVAVFGAGSGIGRQVSNRIIAEAAHVINIDLKEDAAQQAASDITAQYGEGIGVAGSGISGCGPAIGMAADITDRESIARMLDQAVLAYGGIDAIVITAGVFIPPDKTGHVTDDQFLKTFDVNVRGSYLVCNEAYHRILKAQNLSVNMVLTTSVNAAVVKKGSMAYDTSKAAANHLVRELAVELAPLARVNAVAPATVVEGSSMFPRDRVIASLTKYEIGFSEAESTEDLRNKLALFYANRTLTKKPVTPADQAEAAYILLTDQLSKTTGQIISVDGGLHEAFLR